MSKNDMHTCLSCAHLNTVHLADLGSNHIEAMPAMTLSQKGSTRGTIRTGLAGCAASQNLDIEAGTSLSQRELQLFASSFSACVCSALRGRRTSRGLLTAQHCQDIP